MKRFLIFGVLALCLVMSSVVQAEESRDARIKAEMVENYLLWQEAWKLRDAERIISFESPDYTTVLKRKSFYTQAGMVMTKAETDAFWREATKYIDKVHDARVEIKKLTIEPNRIVILSNQRIDFDMSKTNKKPEKFYAAIQSRDIWVQYDRIWMLKRMEILDWRFGGKSIDEVW